MDVKRIENGAVIYKPCPLYAFQIDGDEYAQASELKTWRDGVIWVAKLAINGKPAEIKPIQTLIHVRAKILGAENSIDNLLSSTFIGTTRGKNGGVRAHMYDMCREEQFELVVSSNWGSACAITLPILPKGGMARRIIDHSEDRERSFDIPLEGVGKGICEYVKEDGAGCSDYNSNEYARKVLTVEGARENGAFIYYRRDYTNGTGHYCKDPKGPQGRIYFSVSEFDDAKEGVLCLKPISLRGSEDGYASDVVSCELGFQNKGRVIAGVSSQHQNHVELNYSEGDFFKMVLESSEHE